jgi:branched-chain amino acid transport system ATP-binding protein
VSSVSSVVKSAIVLEIRNLTVDYGEISGVRDLTMSVADGEIVALLGANGAGKSTTLKAVMGMVTPTHGEILVNGEDVTGRPPHTAARRGIALVPEGRRIFKRMTVRENLQVGGVTRARTEIAGLMADVFALFARLKERQHQLAGTLSGGEQQMLAIGRALMSKPDFVLFDEPSLGLAPLVVEHVFAAIGRIRRERGIGGILVEQKVDAALNLVERAHVLSRGVIVLSGAASRLQGSPQLQQAYLGTLNQDVTDVVRR